MASVPGTYALSHTANGEWTTYTVDVKQTGNYKIVLNHSGNNANGRVHMEIDGTNVTGTIATPNTTGYGVYKDLEGPVVPLTAGRHILKFSVDVAGFNVYKFKFIPQ